MDKKTAHEECLCEWENLSSEKREELKEKYFGVLIIAFNCFISDCMAAKTIKTTETRNTISKSIKISLEEKKELISEYKKKNRKLVKKHKEETEKLDKIPLENFEEMIKQLNKTMDARKEVMDNASNLLVKLGLLKEG